MKAFHLLTESEKLVSWIKNYYDPGEVFQTLDLANRLKEDPTQLQFRLRRAKNQEILGVVLLRVVGSHKKKSWYYKEV